MHHQPHALVLHRQVVAASPTPCPPQVPVLSVRGLDGADIGATGTGVKGLGSSNAEVMGVQGRTLEGGQPRSN